MRRGRLAALCGGVVLGALALAHGAAAACSTDPCAGGGSASFDCDRDGFSDAEECSGLATPAAAFAFPSCRVAPGAQPECLDPTRSDLFVKFEKVATSAYTELLISDVAAFGMITQATGGLAMRVHVLPGSTALLPAPQPNSVTARMAALVVREVRGTSTFPSGCPITSALGAINGVTSVGGAAVAQIFTQRIMDHVSCVYSSAGGDPNGAAARADKITMIRHTTAHETTHAHRLAPDNVERFGGHHYRTGTGCVMDQSSTYTTRGGVRFATPVSYCGPDQAAVAAGETALGKIQCEDPGDTLDRDNFTIGCLPATP